MRQLKITKSITNRESQSLDKYLQEIGREELITAEMEVELAQRIKNGDQLALEKLTKANWQKREIDKIEFYNLGGNLIYSEKINEISNLQFQKNYDRHKVFSNTSNKISLVRVYHKNGNVKYGKIIAK